MVEDLPREDRGNLASSRLQRRSEISRSTVKVAEGDNVEEDEMVEEVEAKIMTPR
jgi:hypothetical protein